MLGTTIAGLGIASLSDFTKVIRKVWSSMASNFEGPVSEHCSICR